MRLTWGARGLLCALAAGTAAQATEVDGDLGGAATIVVTAPGSTRVKPPVIELGPSALYDRQPRNAAEALRGLAGVSIRPNSRGETIVRIRGADERQTQVFLDGAPFSVPWDGRVDLGQLPAGLLGRITVTKGAVPIEYGVNAVNGVVDLQTRRGGEHGVTGVFQLGTYGTVQASGVATVASGGFDATFAAGLISRDAERIADRDALPFSPTPSKRRINTDLDSRSVFGAVGYEQGDIAVRASLLHIDSERGIAPESDRNPAVFAPRYWRYPDFRLTQLIVSADTRLSAGTTVRAVAWRQWFAQTIDAYRTASYTALGTREDDDDDSYGGRVTLAHAASPVALRVNAQAQRTTHAQVDTPFPSAVAGPRLRYRQALYSLGVEADAPLGTDVTATLGAGYDRATYPLTGDKPAQAAADALAFSAALRWRAAPTTTVTLSGGRRTRFAAPRELFGEALGPFLLNPDLRPERAWLADLEVAYADDGIRLSGGPFLIRGDDTLSQRVVNVGGASLRQRFNLDGSTSFGADAAAVIRVAPRLDFELAATALHARADAGGTAFRRLVQRPDYEVTAAIDYRIPDGIDLRGEVRRIGPAVDLAPDGQRADLPPATEINLRAAYPLFRLHGGARISLTAAADNVTEAVVLPQLGLPLAGRTLRVGVRLD